jgi:hemoglobin-like flavoprotein
MNADRKRLVKESWQSVAADHDRIASAFYERLFEIAPHTRELFARTNMVEQRVKVTTMLGDIAANLDHLEELIPIVGALGRRHRGYGVQDPDYDRVREALLGAIAAALGDAFTREVRSAWEEAYALTASVMKRAGEPTRTGAADSPGSGIPR